MYNITKPFSKTGPHKDLAPRPPQTTLQPFFQFQCIGGMCHKLGGGGTHYRWRRGMEDRGGSESLTLEMFENLV